MRRLAQGGAGGNGSDAVPARKAGRGGARAVHEDGRCPVACHAQCIGVLILMDGVSGQRGHAPVHRRLAGSSLCTCSLLFGTAESSISDQFVFLQAEKSSYWCWFAAVKSEHQRQGVFRAMLDVVTEKATAQNAVMSFLTSNSTNVRAASTVLFSQADWMAETDRARGAGRFREQGAYESVCAVGRVGVLVLGEGYMFGLSRVEQHFREHHAQCCIAYLCDHRCTIFAIRPLKLQGGFMCKALQAPAAAKCYNWLASTATTDSSTLSSPETTVSTVDARVE